MPSKAKLQHYDSSAFTEQTKSLPPIHHLKLGSKEVEITSTLLNVYLDCVLGVLQIHRWYRCVCRRPSQSSRRTIELTEWVLFAEDVICKNVDLSQISISIDAVLNCSILHLQDLHETKVLPHPEIEQACMKANKVCQAEKRLSILLTSLDRGQSNRFLAYLK